MTVLTLGDVFSEHNLPWTHSLYLPCEGSWTLETPAMIIDDRFDEPLDDVVSRFRYVLSVPDVQDIVENARLQGRVTCIDFLRAFNFYLSNDAFIDFSTSS